MNGRIVSDTGPLIALAIIEHLDILKILFNEVIVPQAVHDEVLQGGWRVTLHFTHPTKISCERMDTT